MDLLLQDRIKTGNITTDMIAAADIAEDIKAVLTTKVTETLAITEKAVVTE